jgi:hypothetical protein
VSFKFPIEFAACRSAIFKRLLPLGILELNTLPSDIFVLDVSHNQEQNFFEVLNFLKPSIPTSLISS